MVYRPLPFAFPFNTLLLSRSPNLRGYTTNMTILGQGKGYGKGPAMVVDSVKSMAIERRFIEIPSRIEQRRSLGQEFQFRPFQMTSSLLTIMTTPNYILVSTFHGSRPPRNQAPAIGFRATCAKVKKEYDRVIAFFLLLFISDIVPTTSCFINYDYI